MKPPLRRQPGGAQLLFARWMERDSGLVDGEAINFSPNLAGKRARGGQNSQRNGDFQFKFRFINLDITISQMSGKPSGESFFYEAGKQTENAGPACPCPAKRNQKQKGRWSSIQQLKYFLFLSHHRKRFAENEVRRSLRMFKHMSVFIKTRNPSQCRIRHMKTMKKFGGIDECIQNYASLHPHFYEKYERIKDYLQLLEDRAYCGDFQNYEKPPGPPTTGPLNTNEEQSGSQPSQKHQQVKMERNAEELPMGYSLECPQPRQPGPELYQIYWHSVLAFQPIIYFI